MSPEVTSPNVSNRPLLKKSALLRYDDALETILNAVQPTGTRSIRLENARGFVLAEEAVTRFPLPRFDNSAVDGYGVLLSDVRKASPETPVTLALAGVIRAGDPGRGKLKRGTAVKILTGAPVPKSVDAVVMREDCREREEKTPEGARIVVDVKSSADPRENIRFAGEEFPKGRRVLAAGSRITPPVVGMLATLGVDRCKVYRKPSVALLVTGSELVKPGKTLKPGKIYESNSYALSAALQDIGLDDTRIFTVKDEKAATRQAFQKALKGFDVVISVGGISVGDFDFVKEVAEDLSIRTVFWGIALKPGKPVYFGTQHQGKKQKWVFGLPGNPVSAMVTYHQLVQPALLKMMGLPESNSSRISARLSRALQKKPGRMELVRGTVRLEDGAYVVTPTTGQDSHMLGGLAMANGLIVFPPEESALAEGQPVWVDLLSWNQAPGL